jgi:SAM-dependent methyltransferase
MPTASNTTVIRMPRSVERRLRRTSPRAIANAYDHAGEDYVSYADGVGLDDPSSGRDRFAHADGIVWKAIRDAIDDLHKAGVPSLRVLDAGCGPGTWLKRIVAYAQDLGLDIEAVGFDISKGQLDIARRRVASCRLDGRWKITFLELDLAHPLPWADAYFHIVLSNYVVLNHLPKAVLPRAIEDLCRVASHRVIVSVRSLASPPTGCIIGTEQVCEYHQDCDRGELKILLKDGTEHRLTFNLYSAKTLQALFAAHSRIVDLRAIDLFLSRFAPDANWTADAVNGLPGRAEVMRKLKEIEEPLCRLPGWVDHGTHILMIAEPLHRIVSERRPPK